MLHEWAFPKSPLCAAASLRENKSLPQADHACQRLSSAASCVQAITGTELDGRFVSAKLDEYAH